MSLGQRCADWRRRAFPPLTWDTALKHYYPMKGALCHSVFAVHVMRPDLLARYFGSLDWAVANISFMQVAMGTGVYVFFRPHMCKVTDGTRVMYSAFAAGLFSLGSVMLWATAKVAVLPNANWARMGFGVTTSVLLLAIGHDYLRCIDELVEGEKDGAK